MCEALSDPPHKGHVAGPIVWLNRLVCFSVYFIRSIFKNLFLFLISHIWHGSSSVTELSKGLCPRLLCVRVGLCCALRRVMHFCQSL